MTLTGSEVPTPQFERDDSSMLRSMLLCLIADHRDRAAACRATAELLRDEAGGDSVGERALAEAAAVQFETAIEESRLALRRLDDGVYGVCEGCAALIPFERLQAMPHVRRCVDCPDREALRR